MRCKSCWSLQLLGLDWIKDSYWGDTSTRYDEGRTQRNKIVYALADHIRYTLFNKDKPRLLDYGSGKEALLHHFINKFGQNFEVANYDPYVDKYKEMPAGKFDIVMCVEVLEHLANVESFYETMNDALTKNGVVVCSTETYIPFGPKAHNLKWKYMTRNIGQHITFWTKRSLAHMGKMLGAKRCAMLKFPNKLGLEFYIFCAGSSTEFLAKTPFRIIDLPTK